MSDEVLVNGTLCDAATVYDLERRVELLESIVLAAHPPSQTPIAWPASQPIQPLGLITYNGQTYKNISGAWLVDGPDVYPIGWALQGAQVSAWAVGVAYKVGDQVSYSGHTYQCLQAHTSQATWDPADAPSLWQLLT